MKILRLIFVIELIVTVAMAKSISMSEPTWSGNRNRTIEESSEIVEATKTQSSMSIEQAEEPKQSERSKKSASTTFCVEIRPEPSVEIVKVCDDKEPPAPCPPPEPSPSIPSYVDQMAQYDYPPQIIEPIYVQPPPAPCCNCEPCCESHCHHGNCPCQFYPLNVQQAPRPLPIPRPIVQPGQQSSNPSSSYFNGPVAMIADPYQQMLQMLGANPSGNHLTNYYARQRQAVPEQSYHRSAMRQPSSYPMLRNQIGPHPAAGLSVPNVVPPTINDQRSIARDYDNKTGQTESYEASPTVSRPNVITSDGEMAQLPTKSRHVFDLRPVVSYQQISPYHDSYQMSYGQEEDYRELLAESDYERIYSTPLHGFEQWRTSSDQHQVPNISPPFVSSHPHQQQLQPHQQLRQQLQPHQQPQQQFQPDQHQQQPLQPHQQHRQQLQPHQQQLQSDQQHQQQLQPHQQHRQQLQPHQQQLQSDQQHQQQLQQQQKYQLPAERYRENNSNEPEANNQRPSTSHDVNGAAQQRPQNNGGNSSNNRDGNVPRMFGPTADMEQSQSDQQSKSSPGSPSQMLNRMKLGFASGSGKSDSTSVTFPRAGRREKKVKTFPRKSDDENCKDGAGVQVNLHIPPGGTPIVVNGPVNTIDDTKTVTYRANEIKKRDTNKKNGRTHEK